MKSEPMTESVRREEKSVTTVRKKRASADFEKVKARMQVPEYLGELYALAVQKIFPG